MTDNDPRPSLADYHRWIDTAESQGFDSVKMPIDDLRALLAVAEAAREIRTCHPGSCCCVFHEAIERFRP